MIEGIDSLIEAASEGKFEDVDALADALRKAEDVDRILELAGSTKGPLRGAAVLAAAGREEPPLLEAVRGLATDRDSWVRRMLALGLTREPLWPLADELENLVEDEEYRVRRQAVKAVLDRPALHFHVVRRLAEDGSWEVRQEAADGLAGVASSAAMPALILALGKDDDVDVQRSCSVSLERHAEELGGFPETGLELPRAKLLREANARLDKLGKSRFPLLAAWLHERARCEVDVQELERYGSVLTTAESLETLPRGYGLEETCAAVLRALRSRSGGAVALVGPSGCGKTSVIHELAHQVARDPDEPWHVVRVSPSDMLAGTTYLGEWETRVKNLLAEVTAPKRVILYVPNLHELSQVGRTSKTDLNVASMLAPYIEGGKLALVGETVPEAYASGLGGDPVLRRVFTQIELRERDEEATRGILASVRDEAGADVPDGVLDRLLDLADFYLPGTALPGRAVGLLRRVLDTHDGDEAPTQRDVLQTLSESTGLPVDLLDDASPLDLAAVRTFFERRVMGQPDAIAAVVDLVALIKAGLTDPGKPFGVFLFVGPTGVGKTELARALAEYLFGDARRLLRLDMSEYASWDGYERLTGLHGRPGVLTRPVRDQPFSVVLLDEIEKAHTSVFDLCLQVFDAGRLTDQSGQMTDFRRTIVILTSNVGAVDPTRKSVGFADRSAADDPERTQRELARTFRPEFLNRIDRIVRFTPLALETAERIARREVAHVLERSGITRRDLVVDVGPDVLTLLLRTGYSPAFGARPLKRTVERLVLLPVAREIATGKIAAGSTLQLRAHGNEVRVRLVAPDVDSEAPQSEPPSAGSVAEGAAELVQYVEELGPRADELAERKSALLAASGAEGFRSDEAGARTRLDTIHRLEDVIRAYRRLRGDARQLAGNAARGRARKGKPGGKQAKLEERLQALSQEYDRVRALLSYSDVRELGDAIVCLSLVSSLAGVHGGVGLSGVDRLARMYQALCGRRRFECEVLDDRTGGDTHEDTISLLVGGGGAFGLLGAEAGLHQLSRTRMERGAGGRKLEDRDVVRVEVLPAPSEADVVPDAELRVESRSIRGESGRLIRSPVVEVGVVHEPSMTTVRVWSDTDGRAAQRHARLILRARIAAAGQAPGGQEQVVRRYVLGPSPLVRDRRSGRSTGNLERVLQGDLRLFLRPAFGG